jgi:hypothetical protein
MSEQLFTMAGTKIFISDKPVSAKGDVQLSDFANTNWIEIGGLYNVGELGGEQAINEFELLNEVWTRKAKGGRNGGSMTNVHIPMALDAGQIKYKEAIESCRPYQFKVERGADCTPESDVTISVADPGVVTWTAHGLFANQPIVFSTTGSLPTGLTAGTVYYVSSTGLTADLFSVSATAGGAPIETTAPGSGVHTASAPPVGMTDYFQGLATDGAKSGGAKNDLYTQTWVIGVDGRIITI